MAENLNPGASRPEANKNVEPEEARLLTREGSRLVEVLEKSTAKHQLVDASRTYMTMFENMNLHPDGTVSEWKMDNVKEEVETRVSALNMTLQDLEDLGYLAYTTSGEAIFTFPGYAYTSTIEMVPHTKEIEIEDPNGNISKRRETEKEPTQVYKPGTDILRRNLAETLMDRDGEMTAREDLVKKLRIVWNQTENLEGIVQIYITGSLTPEAMDTLCNAEGRTVPNREGGHESERVSVLRNTEGGVEYREGHEFGDAKSVALKCFEIAAFSERPVELEALLKRPGIRELFKVTDQSIDDLFLPPEERGNRPLDPKLVKWIGLPYLWKQGVRNGKEDLEKPTIIYNNEGNPVWNVNSKKELVGSRGLLTEKGNILCESNYPDLQYISEQIERFIGGGNDQKVIEKSTLAQKDARDARFVAWGELRVTAMASDLGNQVYHVDEDKYLDRPAGDYIFHDMGTYTSCDRVKVIAPNIFRNIYRYLKTEIRGFGPDGSLGKYPDRFAVPYFKAWKTKTEHGTRTFDEMRWGYRAGKEMDFLTEKMVDMPEEKAYREGELPWRKLAPKAHNAAALGPYIAGRQDIGLFQHATETRWKIDQIKDKSFFPKIGQYMGICFSEQVVWNGKLRGIYNGKPATEEETKNKIKSHDTRVKVKVADEIRNYKKKYLLAFWDGLRSLPQYREWCYAPADGVATKDRGTMSNKMVSAIERARYRLGRIGILTPNEAKSLSTDALGSSALEY